MTKNELDSLAEDVFYVVEQCYAIFIWYDKIENEKEITEYQKRNNKIINNSLIESTLLFIRKLNQFFTAQLPSQRQNEDAFALDFPGFNNVGWFLTKEEYEELHTRVGHITTRETKKGKIGWPLEELVIRATEKALPFLSYLCDSCYLEDENMNNILKMRKKLIELEFKKLQTKMMPKITVKLITEGQFEAINKSDK